MNKNHQTHSVHIWPQDVGDNSMANKLQRKLSPYASVTSLL